MSLRLAFMGTPEFAVPTLVELIGQGHEIACVYSQPPRPKGRGLATEPSPVHALALMHGIAVRTPASLKDPAQQELFAALGIDAAIVVAYGLLLPKPILDAPRLGCFNLHGSLLPRWRGAAPIQRAIMAGDEETGVMSMRMEEGLDTGPVLMAERTKIGRKTYGELHDELARLGGDVMARTLAALERGSITEQPQPAEGATYAKKISEGRNAHRLDEVRARDRLPHPRPVAHARRVDGREGRKGEDPELRTDDRKRCAGHAARRCADHRLRLWRAAPDAAAASRQIGDGGWRVVAWIPAAPWNEVRLTCRAIA